MAPAAPAASTRVLFLRFIYLDGLAVKVRPVHFGYRRFTLLILSKSHESKPPGAPRIAFRDNLGFGDFPM
jgi:hypothetical protein